MGICAARDLRNISNRIHKTSQMAKTTPVTDKMVINKAAIVNAIDQYVRSKIELDYDFIEETDEERQNRHHKEDREMHEMHFIQQQKIQVAMYNNQEVSTFLGQSYHKINYKGQEEIDDTFSDEQNKLFKDKMKSTWARQAQVHVDCPKCQARVDAAAYKLKECGNNDNADSTLKCISNIQAS